MEKTNTNINKKSTRKKTPPKKANSGVLSSKEKKTAKAKNTALKRRTPMKKSPDLPSPAKKTTDIAKIAPEKDLEAPGAENLDKVREILFGMKMRDYDHRISSLESNLRKEISSNAAEMEKRIDSLENYFKKEINTLSDKIQAEQNQRDQAVKELNQRLNEIDKRILSLDDKLIQANRNNHEEILEQSKTLRKEMKDYHDELCHSLTDSSNELNNKKADCSYLASLFSEMAMRLNNELDLNFDLK